MEDNPFNNLADDYLSFRPGYPKELFSNLASLSSARGLAVDCGCGNGQATVALASYFERVIGADLSKEQIDRAIPAPNVKYLATPADTLPVEDCSVDLLTVSNALHWFNLDEFYKEVRRVLKPEGAIAAWSYWRFEPTSDIAVAVENALYPPLEGRWSPALEYVRHRYENLPFPFQELSFPRFSISFLVNFHELFGYVRSWSAVGSLNPQERDNYLSQAEGCLREIWGDLFTKHELRIPMAIKVGKMSPTEAE